MGDEKQGSRLVSWEQGIAVSALNNERKYVFAEPSLQGHWEAASFGSGPSLKQGYQSRKIERNNSMHLIDSTFSDFFVYYFENRVFIVGIVLRFGIRCDLWTYDVFCIH